MIDEKQKKRIHIIGIKGWGTSALAQLLVAQGNTVCGSDFPTYYRTQDLLTERGIILEEFCDHIHDGVDEVIYSTAYMAHPEFVDARKKGISCFSYPERLAPLLNSHAKSIAVSGTHGKTTTTGWLAYVLHTLGVNPSALIGSRVTQFGTNVLAGDSDYFVLEADEYQKKLDRYNPCVAVITSVEYDHPDFFKTEEEYREVFKNFAQRVIKRGKLLVCWEDAGVRATLGPVHDHQLLLYGFDESYTYSAQHIEYTSFGSQFEIFEEGERVGTCAIQLLGTHNILNALAVYGACRMIGMSISPELFLAISSFQGTARRAQLRAPLGNTVVIDDYAHHPTEVRVTLQAIRNQYPDKKILCVFFPHTFSRTEKLFKDFVTCFDSADEVALIDIYGSVREQSGTVTSQQLADAINARVHGNVVAHATGSQAQTGEFVKDHIHAFDVLVTMGAEDLWKEWDVWKF